MLILLFLIPPLDPLEQPAPRPPDPFPPAHPPLLLLMPPPARASRSTKGRCSPSAPPAALRASLAAVVALARNRLCRSPARGAAGADDRARLAHRRRPRAVRHEVVLRLHYCQVPLLVFILQWFNLD